MSQNEESLAELWRVRRVADMLCTAHAGLADDYGRYALVVDLGLLALSGWVASLAFVDPKIAPLLTPPGLNPTTWIGLMGVAAFLLALIQMRLDLRGRADAHRRTFDAYSEVKREFGHFLAADGVPDPARVSRALSLHGFAASLGVRMPDEEFLRRKQIHLIKIRISRHLDDHPAASLTLLRIRMWWMDSFSREALRSVKEKQWIATDPEAGKADPKNSIGSDDNRRQKEDF